ncbi:sperm acrosome membrane-associated protein 4 [Ictalurus punctatus]|uniref:Sperm acrosome membrane-associated protein 4 n=1 Tax=Ictalurus punctatus TaxID=7998 RepID=A0A2D0QKX2_ICTPU|nr:sperm acrosome membrane-associated protein 4 [Ictalurus punctatus]
MSGVVLGLCVVVLLISVSCSGQTLDCFQCELGFWDMCHTTKTNCSAGEQCFVGIGVAASVLKIKMMGCLANDHCNKTTIVTFPANKTLYKMTRTCCGENYCNGGPEVLMASLTLMALVIAQIMGINL